VAPGISHNPDETAGDLPAGIVDWAVSVAPVGMVTYGRLHPQQTDHWGGVISVVHIDHRFSNDCLVGLDEFSHAEILFLFHLASEREAYPPLRPRGRPDLPKVGVFADRGARRPNRIGATICEILQITGHQLTVRGLDAVVGTPVLDIKPVMRECLPQRVRQPQWADSLISDYFAP
jgi:tRNA-Thr(GGU) m(6)t(6)A37 methyltransferase TsaA